MARRAPAAALLAGLVTLMATAAVPARGQQASPPPASEAETMALAVPLGVVEVAIGGIWRDGPRGGVYRALVVHTGGEDSRAAKVFLQWVLEGDDGRYTGIAANVGISEFNDRALPEVSVALDGAGENVARLTLEAPEAADPALRRMVVLAARPGKYVVVPAPANAGREGDTGTVGQNPSSSLEKAGPQERSAPASAHADVQPAARGAPRASEPAPPAAPRARRKIRKRSKANTARPAP